MNYHFNTKWDVSNLPVCHIPIEKKSVEPLCIIECNLIWLTVFLSEITFNLNMLCVPNNTKHDTHRFWH